MVLNYIWLAFFLTAFAVASVRLIFFGFILFLFVAIYLYQVSF